MDECVREYGDLRMIAHTCRDRIRFRLSDERGCLCFEAFEIINASECRECEAALRDYLVGRPLMAADAQYLRSLQCASECECVSAVAREVEKYQRMFGGSTDNRPAYT